MCEDKPSPSTHKIGRFVIKDEEEDEFKPGSLFARRKEVNTPLRIPEKKHSTERRLPKEKETVVSDKKLDSVIDYATVPLKNIKPSSSADEIMNTKDNDLVRPTHSKEHHNGTAECSPKKRKNCDTKKPKQKEEKVTKKSKLVGRPFGKLMEDVVLVISGYQNPHRGNLRSMALEMGARYKPDWDNSCTHLICAFPNTPKFQQVQGKGYIVRKEWVENCHRNRKRLPWRRYALDKKDLCKPESEDEIPELIENTTSSPQQDSDNEWQESGSDTEDEIEKVKVATQQRDNTGHKIEKVKIADQQGEEIEDVKVKVVAQEDDTDVESETELPDTSNIPLPDLGRIFTGKCFYLCDELDVDVKKQLHRYIVAQNGLLSEQCDDSVDYVISEKRIKTVHKVVRPDWIWRCNDSEKLLPTKLYEIS